MEGIDRIACRWTKRGRVFVRHVPVFLLPGRKFGAHVDRGRYKQRRVMDEVEKMVKRYRVWGLRLNKNECWSLADA